MSRTTAHIIRMIGLVIEMAGVLAVYSGRDDPSPMRVNLGAGALPVSWLILGIGFIVWFTGTILVFRSRPSKKKPL
jgi:hypothetical protein